MHDLPKPGAVIFAADVVALTRFYCAIASLRVVETEASHALLEIDGFELVIHAMRGAGDTPTAPSIREDTCVKLCLPVTSIAAARTRAAELGGAIQPPAREWEWRGVRACDGHDPEGNVIQVREPAR